MDARRPGGQEKRGYSRLIYLLDHIKLHPRQDRADISETWLRNNLCTRDVKSLVISEIGEDRMAGQKRDGMNNTGTIEN